MNIEPLTHRVLALHFILILQSVDRDTSTQSLNRDWNITANADSTQS